MTTSLVLVLADGIEQKHVGDGQWVSVKSLDAPLKLYGITAVRQELVEPDRAVCFSVEFVDTGNCWIAQDHTAWKIGGDQGRVLFATTAADTAGDQPKMVLLTTANETTRTVWRNWSTELRIRAPKWSSYEERQQDEARHEAIINGPLPGSGGPYRAGAHEAIIKEILDTPIDPTEHIPIND